MADINDNHGIRMYVFWLLDIDVPSLPDEGSTTPAGLGGHENCCLNPFLVLTPLLSVMAGR